MNCTERKEAIALYAGGDLPETEGGAGDSPARAELERHLAECAECRIAVEMASAVVQLARDAHAEPIAPAHYAAVRARVVAELRQERQPVWRRAWAWGLAGAAAVALVVLLFPAKVKTPGAVRQAFQPGGPLGDALPRQGGAGLSLPVPAQPRSGARLATLRHGAGRLKPAPPTLPAPRQPEMADLGTLPAPQTALQVAAAAPTSSEPLVIKLFTADPNVVIYWIAESRGE